MILSSWNYRISVASFKFMSNMEVDATKDACKLCQVPQLYQNNYLKRVPFKVYTFFVTKISFDICCISMCSVYLYLLYLNHELYIGESDLVG